MVLAVRHRGKKMNMALKIAPISETNPGAAHSLKSEMRILQKVRHCNIINVYNSEDR